MIENNTFESSETHNCLSLTFNLQTATQFCQNLPTHNITESAALIFQFFKCFNFHQVDSVTRHQINQLFSSKIDYIFEHFFKKHLSLFNQNLNLQHSVLTLIESLFILLKQSHQIVIEHQVNKFFTNKDILSTGIAHCLRLNLKCLFIYLLSYTKTPKNFWLDSHSLYKLAEDQKIINKTLSPIDKEIAHICISDWYKHILLFSIVNPYKLYTQELLLLYHALAFWTKEAKIQPFNHTQNELFSLDLTKDSPPIYISLNLFSSSKNSKVLILKKLTQYLETLLSTESNASYIEKSLPSNLIKQLISTWTYFSNRGQDRIEIKQPAKAFTGLNNVIQATLAQNESSFSFIFDCMIINESPGGYCLEIEVHMLKNKQLQTGEILGLSNQTHPQLITLCVIRWVKQLDPNKIQCGLQLLGHQPKMLNIQIMSEHDGSFIGEPQQILFIPEMTAFGREESIVSPGMPFKTGMKLKLLDANPNITDLSIDKPVELSELLLSTSSFKQFYIQS